MIFDPDHHYYTDMLTAEEIHPALQSYILKHVDLNDQPLRSYDEIRLLRAICVKCGDNRFFLKVASLRDLFRDNIGYDPRYDSFVILCGRCEKDERKDPRKFDKYRVLPKIKKDAD